MFIAFQWVHTIAPPCQFWYVHNGKEVANRRLKKWFSSATYHIFCDLAAHAETYICIGNKNNVQFFFRLKESRVFRGGLQLGLYMLLHMCVYVCMSVCVCACLCVYAAHRTMKLRSAQVWLLKGFFHFSPWFCRVKSCWIRAKKIFMVQSSPPMPAVPMYQNSPCLAHFWIPRSW